MAERYIEFLDDLFINNKRNFSIYLSGGVDSALALYLFCQYVVDNNLTDRSSILPIHGFDTRRKQSYSPKNAHLIVDYMKTLFPTVVIKDLYVFGFKKHDNESKQKYLNPALELLVLENKCDNNANIVGSTKKPEHFEKPSGTDTSRSGKDYEDHNMITSYDKKWVAKMYKEHDLGNLLPYTVSCVADTETPCKKCWWCKERYWAFGKYDD